MFNTYKFLSKNRKKYKCCLTINLKWGKLFPACVLGRNYNGNFTNSFENEFRIFNNIFIH